MKALKSPVNRMGGKYFLRHLLIEKMPEHTLYCEPFCGAGHLLFGKPPSEVEVINDIDNHLIAFFKVIKDPVTRQKLIETLGWMPYSRRLWQEFRERWKSGNIPDDSIEASAMWFYLNRTCFSGDMLNGGFALPSITGRNPSMTFANTVESLSLVAKRLKGVTIENLDCRECIKRYDSPDSLFYIDPPYLDTEHYYGKASLTHNDHYSLAKLLYEVKGKVMLTHYASPVYDELYRGWYRQEYVTFKGSHKAERNTEKPKTIEVLYTNYKPYEPEKLFKNI